MKSNKSLKVANQSAPNLQESPDFSDFSFLRETERVKAQLEIFFKISESRVDLGKFFSSVDTKEFLDFNCSPDFLERVFPQSMAFHEIMIVKHRAEKMNLKLRQASIFVYLSMMLVFLTLSRISDEQQNKRIYITIAATSCFVFLSKIYPFIKNYLEVRQLNKQYAHLSGMNQLARLLAELYRKSEQLKTQTRLSSHQQDNEMVENLSESCQNLRDITEKVCADLECVLIDREMYQAKLSSDDIYGQIAPELADNIRRDTLNTRATKEMFADDQQEELKAFDRKLAKSKSNSNSKADKLRITSEESEDIPPVVTDPADEEVSSAFEEWSDEVDDKRLIRK